MSLPHAAWALDISKQNVSDRLFMKGCAKWGLGRLSPHTRSCMTAASRMDKIDRAIVLEESWWAGAPGCICRVLSPVS